MRRRRIANSIRGERVGQGFVLRVLDQSQMVSESWILSARRAGEQLLIVICWISSKQIVGLPSMALHCAHASTFVASTRWKSWYVRHATLRCNDKASSRNATTRQRIGRKQCPDSTAARRSLSSILCSRITALDSASDTSDFVTLRQYFRLQDRTWRSLCKHMAPCVVRTRTCAR